MCRMFPAIVGGRDLVYFFFPVSIMWPLQEQFTYMHAPSLRQIWGMHPICALHAWGHKWLVENALSCPHIQFQGGSMLMQAVITTFFSLTKMWSNMKGMLCITSTVYCTQCLALPFFIIDLVQGWLSLRHLRTHTCQSFSSVVRPMPKNRIGFLQKTCQELCGKQKWSNLRHHTLARQTDA